MQQCVTNDSMTPTWTTCKLAPCLARILAKHNELLLTDAELMKRLGWTKAKLIRIYRAATWDDVTVGDMDRFLEACGLHPANQRRYLWLIKRAWTRDGIANMRHLRSAGQPWRASMVAALLQMVERVLSEHARKQAA